LASICNNLPEEEAYLENIIVASFGMRIRTLHHNTGYCRRYMYLENFVLSTMQHCKVYNTPTPGIFAFGNNSKLALFIETDRPNNFVA
jgi:hypothetical protein